MSAAAPKPRSIYLDNHATTPVDPRVAREVVAAMTESFGNANSVDHDFGSEAAGLIEQARTSVSVLAGSDPDGVVFTSGSTESIQLALRHAAACRKGRPLRIAVSAIEHQAVLDAVQMLEAAGAAEVSWLPVDGKGRLQLDVLEKECASGVDLVCVMAANNEVGTINPVSEIARLTMAFGAQLMVDATQAAGRIELNFDAWNLSYLCFSAHKIYGPKGIGALIVQRETRVRKEHGTIRGTGAGTPNVPGIVGLGYAAHLRTLEMHSDEPRIAEMRDSLQLQLIAGIPELMINGDSGSRLSGNLHVSVPGVPNDVVVNRLRPRVAVSTGAACMSGAQAGSHVLKAMGLSKAAQIGALRIGLGKFTTVTEVDLAAEVIRGVISEVRRDLVDA